MIYKSSSEAEASDVGSAGPSLRHCLGRFATGVAVATYEAAESGRRGLTVNSFTSGSLDPLLILLCLEKRSKAVGYLLRSQFAANVLGADQRDLAWHFAGKPGVVASADRWRYVHDIPILLGSLAWLTCEPFANHDAGDHVVVIGRVTDHGVNDREPLRFFRGQFIGLAQSSLDGKESAA